MYSPGAAQAAYPRSLIAGSPLGSIGPDLQRKRDSGLLSFLCAYFTLHREVDRARCGVSKSAPNPYVQQRERKIRDDELNIFSGFLRSRVDNGCGVWTQGSIAFSCVQGLLLAQERCTWTGLNMSCRQPNALFLPDGGAGNNSQRYSPARTLGICHFYFHRKRIERGVSYVSSIYPS